MRNLLLLVPTALALLGAYGAWQTGHSQAHEAWVACTRVSGSCVK
jgi:hypothetical protein